MHLQAVRFALIGGSGSQWKEIFWDTDSDTESHHKHTQHITVGWLCFLCGLSSS